MVLETICGAKNFIFVWKQFVVLKNLLFVWKQLAKHLVCGRIGEILYMPQVYYSSGKKTVFSQQQSLLVLCSSFALDFSLSTNTEDIVRETAALPFRNGQESEKVKTFSDSAKTFPKIHLF